jgi:hypothetical protein
MQVAIEFGLEQVSRMVYTELLETRNMFLEDMESNGPAVFSCNEVYDKMQIQKHIDALDVILEWYREP